VRVGRWKYIHKVEPELYDIRNDPGESNNLAEAHPDVAEDLKKKATEWYQSMPSSR